MFVRTVLYHRLETKLTCASKLTPQRVLLPAIRLLHSMPFANEETAEVALLDTIATAEADVAEQIRLLT